MLNWKLWLVYITVAVAFALPACAQDPTPVPCGPGTDHTCFEPGSGASAVHHVSNWAFEDGIVVLFREGIEIPSASYPIVPCRLDLGFVPSGVFSTDLGESFKVSIYKIAAPSMLPDITKAGPKIFGPQIYDFLLPASPVEVVYAFIEDLSMGGYWEVPTINEGDFAVFIQYSTISLYIPYNNYIDWDFSTDALFCSMIPHTNILYDQSATNPFQWLEDTPLEEANWIVELYYLADQTPATPDVPALSGTALLILVGLMTALLLFTRR